MDLLSGGVTSLEGYNHAIVITDDATMFRWVYGLKTKDEANAMIRKWVSDISDISEQHPIKMIIRDNAGEFRSKDINEFVESIGAKNYFSIAYEQWQNGLAESSINSLMTLARAQLAESGLSGRFWFRALSCSTDARNATYHERTKTTPFRAIYGRKQNLSKFRAFGCRAYLYLNEERRPAGKYHPRAVEGIHLGFATDSNTSGYVIYIPATKKIILSNQVRFDELLFPYRKSEIVDKFVEEEATRSLKTSSTKTYVPYDPNHKQGPYKTVHYDFDSDELTLELVKQPGTYVQTHQSVYLNDLLNIQKAFLAKVTEQESKAPDNGVLNLNKPPKSYKDAMNRLDSNEWYESYRKEWQGFKDRDTMDIVPRPPGVKVLDSLTRNEYKTVDGTLQRRKTRWCIRGDQQEYHVEDRYAPVLKAPEARLIAAIAAQHKCDLYSTDTKQAFLYGDMLEDEEVYVKPPDWWFDPIPEGHVFKLKKAIYGTKQAARRWHTKISSWMEANGYPAVNSEKTIFMKRAGDDFIIHGLFVDDIMTAPTKKALMDEFIEKYSRDFEITGGRLMEKFIGLSVEQDSSGIALHLDQYIKDAIEQHESFIKKSLRPKFTPMQPGNTLSASDSPITPDPRLQTHYRSMVATLQFAATWVRFDISFAVSQLARFCASAGPTHHAALHHLMEYLVRYPSFKLEYSKKSCNRMGLDGFCDSDWASSDTRRSTTGFIFRYNGAPIQWKTKLQKTISLSTAEAEYYAASLSAIEVLYLRTLLHNMGFLPEGYTPVFEDNNACIEWGNNIIGGRERAKHIDIRKHFAHEVIQSGQLRLIRVSTEEQLADMFTKSLQPRLHAACLSGLLRKPWT